MPDVPKVEPPLDEIEVTHRYNRAGKGVRKPYLVVSLDCLHEIFCNENAIIAEEDVERLAACLCHYAGQSGVGDAALAAEMQAHYNAIVESEDDGAAAGPRYRCPNCHRDDALDVTVQCWARIDQGDRENLQTDIDTSDQMWDGASVIRCAACNHSGKVDGFLAEAGDGGWKHVYSVTKCPKCNHDLTAADGVLIETYVVGSGNNFVPSRLDTDGLLVDVDDVVANGAFSDTLCGECQAPLNEHEVL